VIEPECRETLERAARLALDSVHREYPNHIGHLMNADGDAKPPREMHPAFYGCFDWHSAVHGHWLLARAARAASEAPLAADARAALETSLTPDNIQAEVDYFDAPGRASFERPYGTAWLLQLSAELREWDDADAERWASALLPLERRCAKSMAEWAGKLSYPVRTGTHGQTAFSFALALDYARTVENGELAGAVEDAARRLFSSDRDAPVAYEPSGHDFLSPCLAEADLMRRIFEPAAFARWFSNFLPGFAENPDQPSYAPVISPDRTDGQFSHLDGLNLSRAWMLEGVAAGLPEGDPRRGGLRAAAEAHRAAGLESIENPHYMGGHWLGTFAAYLLTRRGLPPR
jgi:hypothetical protein